MAGLSKLFKVSNSCPYDADIFEQDDHSSKMTS